MIDTWRILADLIAALRGKATVTSLLDSATEVREINYMGDEFGYPAIRVRIDTHEPMRGPEPCDNSIAIFSIFVYTEDASSLTCQEITAAVKDFLHRSQLAGIGYNIATILSTGISAPAPTGPQTWMQRSGYRANIYPS